jgi:predicted peptidase
MRRCILGACALTVLLITMGGCGDLSIDQANAGAAPNTGFLVKSLKVEGTSHKYGVFVPHTYKPDVRWPVIVFLHGLLQAGSDGTSCMKVGIGPAVGARAKDFPFIVVFPQSPDDWKGESRERIAIACLDQVERDYSTDRNSVCLTGISNGGYGTWAIGAHFSDRFSTLVPLCGYSDFDDVPRLTHTPIWCFHNSGDFLVSPGAAEDMCERIKKAGGNVRFTKYGAIGHDCWSQTYARRDLYEWILAHRRGPAMGTGDRAGSEVISRPAPR